jgi:enoyl-CoA hydratase/carnithine racemase
VTEDDSILLDRDGPIARVTLNRPAKLNAVSLAMWDRLAGLFAELDAAPDLRCILITGAGGKAFSVGADIAEFEQERSSAETARAYGKRTHAALGAIADCRHPVVAVIDGLCVGGGLELACTCDLRLCSRHSRFGIPIKRLGLVVAYAELAPLLHLVGPANAKEILLEGQVFDAERALAMGLVNRITDDDHLTAEAAATAARASRAVLDRRALRGHLASLGRPQVRLGDALRLREVPREPLNELFQVRRVAHRIGKRGGFTTHVEFRSFG